MKRVPFLFVADTSMARRHRTLPWADTAIGVPERWDTALKTLVPIMLASNQPMFVVWGPSRTLLYNDAYATTLGSKHPAALGSDFLDVWSEIRAELEPLVEGAYRGEPFQADDLQFWMERHGYREEAHFTFFYSPIRSDTGEVAGFFCACTEITEQILSERRLAESESRHRSILANMEEGFYLFDRDFNIAEVNDAGTRILGLARDELLGWSHWVRFPGTRETALGAMYEQVLADGSGRILQHMFTHPDGREQWLEIRAFRVLDGVAAVFRDVTERMRLEAEAAASMERVQLAMEAGAIVGTWMWDIRADRIVADERFAISFGLDPSKLAVGMPIEHAFSVIHPEDQDRVRVAVGEALRHRSQYRCQYRVHRDGSYRWVEACGRVEIDASGNPSRFPGVLLDIEDRRQVEAERDSTAALLKTFIEAVPGVVYAKDRNGRFLLANRGTAELLGCPPEQFIGSTDAEILQDADEAAAVMALDRQVMESGTSTQSEEVVRWPNGTSATWWSTKEPLRDADGQVIGLVGTSVDITDRKRMVEALRDADRRKDEFLAMLAHELRNPLAPISTATHLLKSTAGDSEPVRNASEIIARQVGHMTRLVDDLLDVSRVTRGLVQLDQQSVDLRAVVSTAIEQAQPLLQSRRHELRTKVSTGPLTVRGDFHRLVQIVANLLNNAAKYTPQAGVIEVQLNSIEGHARLSVVDNGVGIGPETLPHVFDLFAQAHRTADRSQGGLGIGLSLVRSLVQLHGGQVHAESAGLHKGSAFHVTLPLTTRSRAPRVEHDGRPRAAALRILLVDDNADALSTLAGVLQLSGHTVHTAGDAMNALELARSDRTWDVCILDIGLPDMTGYELAGQLRLLPGTGGATLIALTGYGQAHDRVISKTAGFSHHLVKPADIRQLLDILDGVGISSGRSQGTSGS